MKKIAFFVEGQTEQIFVERLVKELLGEKTSIISKRTVGGGNVPKQEFVRSAAFVRRPIYQTLIYDCGSDNRVKSEILDNIVNLKDSGYCCIIGMRDLYPLEKDELPRLEKGLKFLPAKYRKLNFPFDVIIAIQEVETWFLAETHHFRKVDTRLTGPFISKYLGFNPFAIDPLERRHPSKDLNDIYQLVGKSYTKRYWQVKKLVKQLDFDHIIRHIRYDIQSLGQLIDIIENFKRKK